MAINDVVGYNNKLLRKLDSKKQNINFCVIDLYFFSIMIKPAMTAQPINDNEEKVR